MPRRVQDIIPGNRRTIRNIPVPAVGAEKKPAKETAKELAREKAAEEEPVKIRKDDRPIPIRRMPITPPPEKPKRSKRLSVIASVILAIVIIAVIAFYMSGRLAKATFTIVPKSVAVQVSGTFVIPSGATTPAALTYETVTVVGTASTTVVATLGAAVETKAAGSVTMYNSYSAQAQRLVAGTRLSGASGLVYRLTSSVVIPGYSTASAGGIVPGKTAASIVADQAGPSYNISRSDSVSDLKVVAFNGTAKYSSIYAQLASDVTGGYSGAKSTVSPSALASTTATLQANLSASLRDKASLSAPAGYITYPAAYAQSFAAASVVPISTTSASVVVKGTLYGIIFKETDLAAMLAGSSSTSPFGSMAYDTPGLENLSFSISNPKSFSPAAKTPLVAKISGSFKLVGSIPAETLKKAFAGVSLAQTGAILKKYSAVIDLADSFGEIAPPWVGTVPSDPARIAINVKKP